MPPDSLRLGPNLMPRQLEVNRSEFDYQRLSSGLVRDVVRCAFDVLRHHNRTGIGLATAGLTVFRKLDPQVGAIVSAILLILGLASTQLQRIQGFIRTQQKARERRPVVLVPHGVRPSLVR
jgi:hypothetical protein